MSTSELASVEALLGRVLPDPSGFAQRLLDELLGRLAGTTGPEEVDLVLQPERRTSDEVADHNLLLAAALGACDCWGADPHCPVCRGAGSSGWTEPDPELFAEYVTPALDRARAHAPSQDEGDPA